MFSFLKKLFGSRSRKNADFELTFSYFTKFNGEVGQQAQVVSQLLSKLSKNSSEEFTKRLLGELGKLRIASNTNSVFFFYFPIVSHILYFKPECGGTLLHHLVGPIFANGDGDEETPDMIRKIQNSMNFKLKENPNFLTKEGQLWVKDILPTMVDDIQNEIDVCKKELDEM